MKHHPDLSLALVACILLLAGDSFSSRVANEAPEGSTTSIAPVGMVKNVDSDDVALLQTYALTSRRHLTNLSAGSHANPNRREICSDMANHGSYFTIEAQIGTPVQAFDIVADTGSNAFIVPDCHCVKAQRCETLDRCFNAHKSVSFAMQSFMHDGVESVPLATLGYGSGDIQCTIASDIVSVKEGRAQMENAIFLMEDRTSLAVDGSFEGIFGLGLPGADMGLEAKLFMTEAGIGRYSLCFNDVDPGVLRMNVPPLVNPMGNIGTVHWGLDLQGMSVGDASVQVLFCDPARKPASMQSACGAIPDSGTTLIMGPREQIKMLYAAICDNWKRCSDLTRKYPTAPKSLIFHELLSNCEDWLDEQNGGVYEMPSIKVNLAGEGGEKQKIELSPWSYVIKTSEPTFKIIHERVFGRDYAIVMPSGTWKSRCAASFGAQDYATTHNGPVWILGSPLFYEHTVSFDLHTTPKTIAVHPQPCTTCQASLLASEDGQQRHRALRHVPTIRWSSIDSKKQHI